MQGTPGKHFGTRLGNDQSIYCDKDYRSIQTWSSRNGARVHQCHLIPWQDTQDSDIANFIVPGLYCLFSSIRYNQDSLATFTT